MCACFLVATLLQFLFHVIVHLGSNENKNDIDEILFCPVFVLHLIVGVRVCVWMKEMVLCIEILGGWLVDLRFKSNVGFDHVK